MSLLGSIFRVMTFGESHGAAVGCVIDGVPPGLPFTEEDVQPWLDRRRPGQNSLTTNRKEADKVEILSGTENGVTLGTPIAMIVRNQDMRKIDYESTTSAPRPGHADYTYQMKYGIRASSGGGRSSARETIGRVCAAALASKYLTCKHEIRVTCFVDSVMGIHVPDYIKEELLASVPSCLEIDKRGQLHRYADYYRDDDGACYSLIDGSPVECMHTSELLESFTTRCPHAPTAAKIAARISKLKEAKDSCGGTVVCMISGLPAGLGEPVFDKFHAELAKGIMSIPAVKGFEIGSGFSGSQSLTGSAHNDRFVSIDPITGRATFASNNSGGVLGGVTTGQTVYFRVALKPVSSIGVPQNTCDFDGCETELLLEGRHDPCVLPRVPQIVESMATLTVMDFVLLNNVYRNGV